jgi:thiol-disulfide isomerase/thioredoxin
LLKICPRIDLYSPVDSELSFSTTVASGLRLAYAPPMRRILPFLALPFLLCVAAHAAREQPSADHVLATAKSEAVGQRKAIFLVFGASWCPPCREMEAFLDDREIRPILEKYFVLASLAVYEERGKHPELNNPGAAKLVADFGGESGGVPFLVFLDAQGQLLINSNRPVKRKPNGENIGYPALPVEIDWFMTMLQKTPPSLSKADARTIETWLRRASPR